MAAWNSLHSILLPDAFEARRTYRARATAIWNHLGWATDEVPNGVYDGRQSLKTFWFECNWQDFFDLLEFAVEMLAPDYQGMRAEWFKSQNELLEEQGCAYRFISQELAPITNPHEMGAVAAAADSSIDAVSMHIRGALEQLPPNPKASTRNSIKESISAVEATLKHLTNSPSATLGEGLKAFEAKYGPLHDSMRRGFEKLYAYTNGPEGIRHALVDGAKEVTVDDARLMLIQCSAFANYLIAVAAASAKT